MSEIKAPHNYKDYPRPYVFLAGSIEMGKADNWQAHLAAQFPDVTILNPRRDDWDSSWVQSVDNNKFREQVEWELQAMDDADLIMMHFEPDTRSPITSLELGLFASTGKLIVHCPEGYWRKGDVDIMCKKYGVLVTESITEFIEMANKRLEVLVSQRSNNV